MNNNHLLIGFEMFDNTDFIRFTQTPYFGLYLYLWRHIIRGDMYSVEKQYVHQHLYIKKNLLATTVGYRSLGKIFGKNKNTMMTQANVLKNMGLIKLSEVPANYSIGRNKQTIFVLGERYIKQSVNGEDVAFEFLYIKDIFKPDSKPASLLVK